MEVVELVHYTLDFFNPHYVLEYHYEDQRNSKISDFYCLRQGHSLVKEENKLKRHI